uniref:TPR_REGION domain-containing protein n=1 Tax=Steinernema glaseri TaxID=37863 RepID=A0A1I8AE63_9BILA
MAYLGTYSIPLLSGRDETLEIPLDPLPNGEEIIDVLRKEKCPLYVWIDLAAHYYTAGETQTFVKLLEISGPEASQDYRDVEKDQMRALDTLAAYYVQTGSQSRDKNDRKEFFAKATMLFTTADKIIMYDQRHLLCRAYFCLVEGNKIDQADTQFNFVINQASNNIPAVLGKACIAFQKKDYKSALFFYKKAIKLKPDCPADVRVGIGYCLYRMGKHEKAREAFERALELNNECVPALIGIAIIDQNTLIREAVQSSIMSMSQAYKLDSENPMVLNHLANHFFCKNVSDPLLRTCKCKNMQKMTQ